MLSNMLKLKVLKLKPTIHSKELTENANIPPLTSSSKSQVTLMSHQVTMTPFKPLLPFNQSPLVLMLKTS